MSVSRRLARPFKRITFDLITRTNLAILHSSAVFRQRTPPASADSAARHFGLRAGGTVLVLAPHPDDEALGAGATIAALSDFGVNVHVLLITDGRLSGAGRLGQTPPERRAAIRTEEFTASVAALGDRIMACGPLAPETLSGDWADDPAVIARAMTYASDCAPTVILAPVTFDYHPDHRATASLARALAARLAQTTNAPALFSYEIQAPFARSHNAVMIPATPRHWQRKLAAVSCHDTQAATARLNLRLARYRAALRPICSVRWYRCYALPCRAQPSSITAPMR